jgi:3-dehydroquinate synthase
MTVQITLPNTVYDINIKTLKNIKLDTKVVIVTNPTIEKLHIDYLLSHIDTKELSIVTVEDGEIYKNMKSIDTILEHCFTQKLNRNSILIAFGGGVIGDMTGFAASIYQRGIDFIQIPTTLLSQVDASVGGKTGINNRFGKNLIGAFHQPLEVNIDTYFLQTLPQREFSAGISEIIKMAVCFDKEFFSLLQTWNLDTQSKDLSLAIEKSVQTKAYVVSQDEKEKGLRAALNYGHTFGHVIENETDYKTYLHGEAVGIGMVMANNLSVKLNLMTKNEALQIKQLLQKYDIPTTYKIENIDRFYDKFFLDKKSLDDKIKFILPVGIGGVKITSDIKKEDIVEVLKGFSV